MRVLLQFVVCSILIVLAACGGDGGDPNRVLNLASFGEITEGELEELLQTQFGASDVDHLQCNALSQISDDEAVEALELLVGSEGFNPHDERRLVELTREMCASAFD